MGAVIGLIVAIIILIVGFALFIVGLVGLIIFIRLRKKLKKKSTVLIVVFSIILTLGVAIASGPTYIFAKIIYQKTQPPYFYVETDIVIEEEGHQAERFTANGVIYERLDGLSYIYDENDYPIFSYKKSGIFGPSSWGNYFAIENPQGFTLVRDDLGNLFCPANEKDTVFSFYSYSDNLNFFCDDGDSLNNEPLTGEARTSFEKFWQTNFENENKTIVADFDYSFALNFNVISKDGNIKYLSSYTFYFIDGSLYFLYDSEHILNDSYTFIALSDEIALPLINM